MIGGTVKPGDAGARLREMIEIARDRETTERALLAGGEVIAEGMRSAIVRGQFAPHTQDQIAAVVNHERDFPSVLVGVAGDQYAVGTFLEFGTSKMSARPWARPGYDSTKDAASEAMSDQYKKDLGL